MSMQNDLSVAGVVRNGIKKKLETWNYNNIIDAIKRKETTGQPCTCNALVKCTSAEEKDETVHIVKKVLGTNIMISDIGQLGENDITREKVYTGCKKSKDKKCTLEEKYITYRKWQETYKGTELNNEEEGLDVESSYMICTYGDGIIFFKDAGQMVRTLENEVIRVKEYVTLDMLKAKWSIKEVDSYDLTTSVPTYKENEDGENVRDITQADVDEINRVLNIYGINTPNRIAHFLAQCQIESDGGKGPIERYGNDVNSEKGEVFDFFKENYGTDQTLGNTQEGDEAKFRGAGAIHITGRAAYEAFSEYIDDSKILEDGALYVGQNYFWEAGAFYWSVYKPSTAGDDRYNLNKKCDENASVEEITGIVNGDNEDKLEERKKAYEYYISKLNGGN